ncbi:BT_3987 domain-containing protein [Segetibacter koreensis]|uniref:BT_3987 domain-containing protein n=1 Tax=Segetibacter koreensis TaxID=398037 RepID=UPI0003617935|nr:DUF1735 domain-containing protein [Segetibacter koreensis]
MNLYIIRKSATLVVIVAFALSGCLKDKDFENGVIQSLHSENPNQNIVEISLTATSTDNFLLQGYDKSDKDTIIDFIPVNLVSTAVAAEDIHVTLALDTTLVSNYNTAHETNYVIPASSMYGIVNEGSVVTIPKGSKTGYLQVKLKTADFLGGEWALAFTIKSVDKPNYIISGNLNTGIVAFSIKNEWDGTYTSNGYVYHPTASRPITNLTKVGATAGANSITMGLGDLGGAGYIALFTIEGTKVTITAAPGSAGAPYIMFSAGLPSTNPGYTPAWSGSESCNNTYDPTTRTFYVRYGYLGGNGYRVAEEKLTRQ